MDAQAPNRVRGVITVALRGCCLVAWLATVALVALLLVQWRMAVLHPPLLPFAALLTLAVLAAAGAVGLAAWTLNQADRARAVRWACLAMLPLWLLAIPYLIAWRQFSQRFVPHGALGQIPIYSAASMMEAQAAWLYPHRLESERIVMFYRDLSQPEVDLETMERHVAELEAKIGKPLRAKIHWVRGPLIGQSNVSFLGIALGSPDSPSDWTINGVLDRHELAHAVITQQRPVGTDPPELLHEGWADAQAGYTSADLAKRAHTTRVHDPDLKVADLLKPESYHRARGEVYIYGGAFVDFLIRRFGVAKFVEIYNRCQPDSYEADFQAVYGQSLAELETDFWQDVDAIRRP